MGFVRASIATSMKTLAAFAAMVLLALPAVAAGPDDVERGRKLAYTCHGCHGIPDYKNAYPNYSVPKLRGQSAQYLAAALTEYRNGNRPHPTMQGQAGTLDDGEIAAIAAYFAGERVVSDGQPTGTLPATGAPCVACHGHEGVGIVADYPTLSGQYADYLEQALNDYRTGKRKNAIMAPLAKALQPADIAALAQYYARQTPSLGHQTQR